MEINFNLDDVKSSGLTLPQYTLLYIINKDAKILKEVDYNSEDIAFLANDNYMRFVQGTASLKLKGLKIFEQDIEKSESLVDLVKEWRNLFPSGMAWGRPIKGSKSACEQKMKKFLKANKVTKEELFNATRFYIDNKKNKFGKYEGQSADYLISKNGESTLEGVLEYVKDNDINVDNDLENNPFIKQV